MAKLNKKELLAHPVEHLDVTTVNVVPLVEAMAKTAFTARDLARAADITDRMAGDKDCGIVRAWPARSSPPG